MAVPPMKTHLFPTSRKVHWQHESVGRSTVLHLTSKQIPKIRIQEKIIGNAARLLEAKQRGFVCFFTGYVESNNGSLNKLTISLNHLSELPVQSCNGKICVPVLLQWKEKEPAEWKKDDYFSDVEEIFKFCSSGCKIDPNKLFKIRIICSFFGSRCDIQVEMSTLSTSFKLIPIQPIYITESELTKQASVIHSPIYTTGFVVVNDKQNFILIPETDLPDSDAPLVGIWVSGVASVHHPFIWAACLRYISCTQYKNRICLPPLPFLMVFYNQHQSAPEFYDCTCTSGNTVLGFQLLRGFTSLPIAKVPILDTKTVIIGLDMIQDCINFSEAVSNIKQCNNVPSHGSLIITSTDDIPKLPHQPVNREAVDFLETGISLIFDPENISNSITRCKSLTETEKQKETFASPKRASPKFNKNLCCYHPPINDVSHHAVQLHRDFPEVHVEPLGERQNSIVSPIQHFKKGPKLVSMRNQKTDTEVAKHFFENFDSLSQMQSPQSSSRSKAFIGNHQQNVCTKTSVMHGKENKFGRNANFKDRNIISLKSVSDYCSCPCKLVHFSDKIYLNEGCEINKCASESTNTYSEENVNSLFVCNPNVFPSEDLMKLSENMSCSDYSETGIRAHSSQDSNPPISPKAKVKQKSRKANVSNGSIVKTSSPSKKHIRSTNHSRKQSSKRKVISPSCQKNVSSPSSKINSHCIGNMAESTCIPFADICEYLKKQDEKLHLIQEKVSLLLQEQTQTKQKCEENHMSKIIGAKNKLPECKNSTDIETNSYFLQYLKEQNDKIESLQNQMNLLLRQKSESQETGTQNDTSSSKDSVVKIVNENVQVLSSENINSKPKQVHTEKTLEDSEADNASLQKTTENKATCSTSTMTSFTFNNDFRHVDSKKCFAVMTDFVQYQKAASVKNVQCTEMQKESAVVKKAVGMDVHSQDAISSNNELNNLPLCKNIQTKNSSYSNLGKSDHIDSQSPMSNISEQENDNQLSEFHSLERKKKKKSKSKVMKPAAVFEHILKNVNDLILDEDEGNARLSLPSQSTVAGHVPFRRFSETGLNPPFVSDAHNSETEHVKKMSEISHVWKLPSTSSASTLHAVKSSQKKEKAYSSKSEGQQCKDLYFESSTITMYGLSSPNLSFATKEYLESYGLVLKKFTCQETSSDKVFSKK